jgi:hypothetical protein
MGLDPRRAGRLCDRPELLAHVLSYVTHNAGTLLIFYLFYSEIFRGNSCTSSWPLCV